MSNQWQHGLCGCFDNCFTCIITYVAPCYTFGKNAEAVGDSCVLCGLASCVPLLNIWFGASTRRKIREQKNIDGGLMSDLLTVCCCPFCALVQSAQEIGSVGSMAIDRDQPRPLACYLQATRACSLCNRHILCTTGDGHQIFFLFGHQWIERSSRSTPIFC